MNLGSLAKTIKDLVSKVSCPDKKLSLSKVLSLCLLQHLLLKRKKSTNVATCRKTTSQLDSKGKSQRFICTCHFCGIRGHIRPRCFTLMNFVKYHYMVLFQRKTPRPKVDLSAKPIRMWVKKSNFNCFTSFACLRTCATNSWYFDNGSSKHMIGDQHIFVDYKSISDGLVTFSDGITRHVLGKETFNVEGFPRLNDVLHVDRLKANLISISQLCDLKLRVNFTCDGWVWKLCFRRIKVVR